MAMPRGSSVVSAPAGLGQRRRALGAPAMVQAACATVAAA